MGAAQISLEYPGAGGSNRRAFLSACACSCALPWAGCLPAGDPDLAIATDLPTPSCRGLEDSFLKSDPRIRKIAWVRPMEPMYSLAQIGPNPPVDLILGASAADFILWERAGVLAPWPDNLEPRWRSLGVVELGLAANAEVLSSRAIKPEFDWESIGDPRFRGLLALDDPRRDPLTLAFAAGSLAAASSWSQGYAHLVRAAANAPFVGPRANHALELVIAGKAAIAPADPALVSSGRGISFHALGGHWTRGVAISSSAPNPKSAAIFADYLARSGLGQRPEKAAPSDPSPVLLPDLLGATLVDAHDELAAAWGTLIERGRPPKMEAFLTEPPPWPPASIQKLESQTTLAALADQLAPDRKARYALIELWTRAPQLTSGPLLGELETAAEGRLLSDPGFRSWLRAEWRAWARQRCRRVTRQTLKESPQEGA